MEKLETGLKLVPVAGLVLSSVEQVPVLNYESDYDITATDCVNLLRAGCRLVQIVDATSRDHYFGNLIEAFELLQLPGERFNFTEGERRREITVHTVTREWVPEKSEKPGWGF